MLKDIIARGEFRTMGWTWNNDGTVTVKVVPRGPKRLLVAIARVNELDDRLDIDEDTVIEYEHGEQKQGNGPGSVGPGPGPGDNPGAVDR